MKINKNLAISESGFVFNPSTGDSFSVNELGTIIISKVKAGKSKCEIIDELTQEYDAEKSTIEKDFNDFINTLNNHQLAEIDE